MQVIRSALSFICPLIALATSGQYWEELIIPAPLEVGTDGRFGSSLSLDGDLLLVGAPGVSFGGPATGAAYLFERNEGGENAWNGIASLHLPTPVGGAQLGAQVLMAGNLAFVAAPLDTYVGMRTGSVYVFEQNLGGPDNWGFKQRIRPDTIQDGLGFGSQLRLVNGTLIVACPGYDENTSDALQVGVGALVLYRADEAGLFEPMRFVRGDALVDGVTARPCMGDRFDHFGELFVHSDQQDAAGGGFTAYLPGRAYYMNADSLLDASLPLPTPHRLVLSETFGDDFADLILTEGAVDGDLLTIGVLHPAVPGVHQEYHRAVTFASDGSGGLVQLASALPDTVAPYLQYWPYGREGWDVLDLFGGRLLAGALGDTTFTPLGHAEVFSSYDGGVTDWTRIAYLQPSDPHAGDRFGATGAIDDRVAIIGAPYYDQLDRGQVYVFVDPDVGISGHDPAPASSICITPQPVPRSIGELQLTITADDPTGTVQLIGLNGRPLWGANASASMRIPIASVAAGVYMLTWRPEREGTPPVTLRLIVTP